MGQFGFFDADNRLTALSAKGDPLEAIDRLVPWESFRGDIEAAVLTPETERKSTAGRKPIDAIVLFRMLILQSLYNLSDEQVEYQVRDRLSFTRFLVSGIEDCIPDGTTLWLFREKLAKAGVIKKLFDRFDQHLGAKGYIARGGQIVDATIVPVPKQRNTREENEAIKGGQTPKAWKKKPAKNRQKDKDARWTKKHGRSFYGYKNHVNADATHKLIRRDDVSDAAVHDSQKLDGLLNKANTSADVFADSAYRSAETEARLKVRGFRSRIYVRATRNHPLSQRQEEANRKKSRVRVRIEHVFGAQETSAGSRLVRTIGIVRARAKIGLQNLVYNVRRLVTAGADGCSMKEKSACAALKRTPDAYGGAAPASDHLPNARRSVRANDYAAKKLLFEVPLCQFPNVKNLIATPGFEILQHESKCRVGTESRSVGCGLLRPADQVPATSTSLVAHKLMCLTIR
jgi:IS5 family transposase